MLLLSKVRLDLMRSALHMAHKINQMSLLSTSGRWGSNQVARRGVLTLTGAKSCARVVLVSATISAIVFWRITQGRHYLARRILLVMHFLNNFWVLFDKAFVTHGGPIDYQIATGCIIRSLFATQHSLDMRLLILWQTSRDLLIFLGCRSLEGTISWRHHNVLVVRRRLVTGKN